jgi:hypothetical protein
MGPEADRYQPLTAQSRESAQIRPNRSARTYAFAGVPDALQKRKFGKPVLNICSLSHLLDLMASVELTLSPVAE